DVGDGRPQADQDRPGGPSEPSLGHWHLVAGHLAGLATAWWAYRELGQGRLRRAAWTILVGLWATVTYVAWHAGGLAGHASPFYCFVALLAALTLDGRERILGIATGVVGVVGLGALGPVGQAVSDVAYRSSTLLLVGAVGLVAVLLDIAMERLAEEVSSANQAAKQANDDKDRLLARVSHYLRTPLNAIVGYTELLTDDARDAQRPRAVRDMSRILQASHGLLSILDDILDVARVQSGTLQLSRGRIDLEALTGQLAATMRPLSAKQSNRLRIEITSVPFEIWLDEGRVRQVLLNLLGNACKFTEGGQVWLRLGPGADDTLRFEVEDTGIGMDEEQQGRVLQPFEQASPDVAEKYGGAGLGLTICVRLVEAMGGELGVSSRPGQGTLFWGELPARRAS
ncbi:MAG: HAMP domain-containing sensor histidine kinase, partial [Myxococcota bacterium]